MRKGYIAPNRALRGTLDVSVLRCPFCVFFCLRFDVKVNLFFVVQVLYIFRFGPRSCSACICTCRALSIILLGIQSGTPVYYPYTR